MRTSESTRALRRANPRARVGFADSVEAAVRTVQAQVAAASSEVGDPTRVRRRRLPAAAAAAAGATVAAAAAVVVLVMLVSPGGGPGVENATAAVRKAAALTAASAERSGTAAVRITHDGDLWAASRIRWNGNDVAVGRAVPRRHGKVGDELRVVDGKLYGLTPEGDWESMGSPSSIDPDSGTTPAEYLASVREDVGGVTLRRITASMTGLTTRRLDNGSVVYSGSVPAAVIARETGFKEGQAIRVLPFGYVAHDEAADAASPLNTAVTVGADGVVRKLDVAWGTWRYTVTYSGLGSTAALVVPANARSLLEERRLRRGTGHGG
jgi:hypothetical protein